MFNLKNLKMVRSFVVVRWSLLVLLLLLSDVSVFSFYNSKWVSIHRQDCSYLSLIKPYHSSSCYDNDNTGCKYQNSHHHMLKRVNTAVSVAAASAIVGDAKMIETMKINPKLLSKTSLLVHLWGAISYPTDTIEETDFVLRDYQLTRYDVEGLTKHFQACKDCAAEGVFLMATQNDEGYDVLRLSNMPCDLLTDDGDDDGWGVYEQDEAVVASEQVDTRPIFPVESDDEVIIIDTKNWVQKGTYFNLKLVLFPLYIHL